MQFLASSEPAKLGQSRDQDGVPRPLEIRLLQRASCPFGGFLVALQKIRGISETHQE